MNTTGQTLAAAIRPFVASNNVTQVDEVIKDIAKMIDNNIPKTEKSKLELAAPEMLDALKRCEDLLTNLYNEGRAFDGIRKRVQSAIKKATE